MLFITPSTNAVAAKDYYTRQLERSDYYMKDAAEMPGQWHGLGAKLLGPGGGMMSMPGGNPGWLSYVGVEDINVATEKAKSLGATVGIGPQEIPNVGWFTMITDPTGCTVAMFQPK